MVEIISRHNTIVHFDMVNLIIKILKYNMFSYFFIEAPLS